MADRLGRQGVLRRHLGPKFDRRLPAFLASAIIETMRLAR
jgi:hypothetical protein